MSFTKVAPAGIGTSPGTSILIGDSLLHSTGIDIGSNTGIGVTIRKHGDATFTGIVTAASFSGSGANLTGIDATAIKHTDGNVKVQATGTGANLTGNLTVSGNFGVGGVLTYEDVTNIDSVGVITARSGIKIGPTAGVAATIFSDGSINTTGIVTATTIKVGTAISITDSAVSATRFHGDGSALTGIDATQITTGNTKVQTVASRIDIKVANVGILTVTESGANVTGIITASTFKGIIVPATYHGGRRNMFINGEFMINQRGTRDPHANQNNGANNLGYGGPDHVQVVKNIGSYDAKQANENSSPRSQAGASYSYELDVTATGSNATAGYCFLNWMWDGIQVNRLLYGTSSARPITVSFWCQCNLTGTIGINMRNYGTDKMISQALTIDSADTWEYKTVTFVGDTAAQFAVTSNATMAIELWLAAGSNYNSGGTQSTWASRNDAKRSAGTNINIAGNTSNYFRISLLQVEMGEFATPFEFRTYGEYLHDCEYYFQKPQSSRGSTNAFAIHIWGHKVADTYALRVQAMMRPTEMRTNPTDYYHDNNPSGLTAQRYQTQGADYEYTYGVAMSIGSNRKEFAGGTKYPYGVSGMNAGESGILWAYDFESYSEY